MTSDLPPPPFPDLFDEAQALFKELVTDLAGYGIEVSAGLELRRVAATLSYYNFDDGHIYLGVPDPAQPVGRLIWLLARSRFACETDDELARFLRLLVPRLVAHEVGHHLRHKYGWFGDDRWHEEQVANQLATAALNRRLSHDDRVDAIRIVRRALDGIAPESEGGGSAAHHDLLGALHADGRVSDTTVIKLETVQAALAISPEDMLTGNAIPSDEMMRMLAERGSAIEQLNSEYVSDQLRYMNYHLGWLYYDLTSRQTATIDEFARVHLQIGEALLDPPDDVPSPSIAAIRATHRAHADCTEQSPTAARYFYKRYRSLLIAALQTAQTGARERQRASLDGWIESLLEGWSDDTLDTLDLLASITPSHLQSLLPHRIAASADRASPVEAIEAELPTRTDVRMWKHVVLGEADPAAANSLERLELLDQSAVFGYLPAEVLLRIAASLSRIRVHQGDTIVWQGDLNSDIYLAVDGELSVLMTVVGRLRQIGRLRPGDVFGEMAFFTGAPRMATVRAQTDALCFVLKASDLRAMVYQHPVILMQMARSLAKRLEAASATQKTLS